jgi:hypothetical protein
VLGKNEVKVVLCFELFFRNYKNKKNMNLIEEDVFVNFASKSVLNAIKKTVDSTVEIVKPKKGYTGEGVTKYTFENKSDILIIFYKYTMTDNFNYKTNYEVYHGYEENDFILDKINDLKNRVESRGDTFVWY